MNILFTHIKHMKSLIQSQTDCCEEESGRQNWGGPTGRQLEKTAGYINFSRKTSNKKWNLGQGYNIISMISCQNINLSTKAFLFHEPS